MFTNPVEKIARGPFMQENEKQIFKLRLKLKSGEEFEAEGSLDFVKAQKDDFLRLASQQKNDENNSFDSYNIKPVPKQYLQDIPLNDRKDENEFPGNLNKEFRANSDLQESNPPQNAINTFLPNTDGSIYQQNDLTPPQETHFTQSGFTFPAQTSTTQNLPNTPNFNGEAGDFTFNTQQSNNPTQIPTENLKPQPHLRPLKPEQSAQYSQYGQYPGQQTFRHNPNIPQNNTTGQQIKITGTAPLYRQNKEVAPGQYNPVYFTKPATAKLSPKTKLRKEHLIAQPQQSVWHRIAYADGPHIILRRKDKNLSSAMAALIILGAAKILTGMHKMPALELARSLKLSGYLKENERLDRILTPEIRLSCLVYEGSKRNRAYTLTQSGTAKAYTSAERVLLSN